MPLWMHYLLMKICGYGLNWLVPVLVLVLVR